MIPLLFTFLVRVVACLCATSNPHGACSGPPSRGGIGLRLGALSPCVFLFLFPFPQNRNALNVTDGRIFWWSLYLTPIVWVLLGVVCVLKFNLSYLLLVVVALVLSSANIIGYYKCSKDATEQMRAYVQQTVLGAAMDRFLP